MELRGGLTVGWGFVFQVQAPVVCGISSLGYDHMEILGKSTLIIRATGHMTKKIKNKIWVSVRSVDGLRCLASSGFPRRMLLLLLSLFSSSYLTMSGSSREHSQGDRGGEGRHSQGFLVPWTPSAALWAVFQPSRRLKISPFISSQHGVPAFTVPQPEEAMVALEEKASQLGVSSSASSYMQPLVSTVDNHPFSDRSLWRRCHRWTRGH